MLTSPSGKSYIGQTVRPIEKRFEEHQLESSNCVAIYRAIQKYGWENFETDWYECPDEELNRHEELMIGGNKKRLIISSGRTTRLLFN